MRNEIQKIQMDFYLLINLKWNNGGSEIRKENLLVNILKP